MNAKSFTIFEIIKSIHYIDHLFTLLCFVKVQFFELVNEIC